MWRARSSWAWPTGQCPKPLGNIIIKYTMACGLTIYQSGTHLTGGGVLAEHLRDAAQVRSEHFALREALGLVDSPAGAVPKTRYTIRNPTISNTLFVLVPMGRPSRFFPKDESRFAKKRTYISCQMPPRRKIRPSKHAKPVVLG